MSDLSAKKWDASSTSMKNHGHGFRTGCQVENRGVFFYARPRKGGDCSIKLLVE